LTVGRLCRFFLSSSAFHLSCRPHDKDKKMARKTSADFRAELADLTDSSQALLDIAKEEDRELTPEETDLFEETMARIEDVKTGLASAEKFEAQKRELAELRSMQSQ